MDKRKGGLLVFALVFALGLTFAPRFGGLKEMEKNDKIILTRMHKFNQLQMQMAKMAIEKTNKSDVKNLAQNVYKDHRKLKEELEEIASEHNINIVDFAKEFKNEVETKKTEELKDLAQKLFLAPDEAVARLYPKLLIAASFELYKTLDLFEEKAANPSLAKIVSKSLPIIKNNTNMAEAALEGFLAE